MTAISFRREWLDALLRGDKQQTTQPQTDRFKVGDIAQIYIEQRRAIVSKPLRRLTIEGLKTLNSIRRERKWVNYVEDWRYDYAHFLGTVEIIEVYDIRPCEMSDSDLKDWATADGFKAFHPTCELNNPSHKLYKGSNSWFMARYGDDWMQQWWSVVLWNGWIKRFFEPEVVA